MIVLDASAVLAVLGSERGSDEVVERSIGGLISTVNLAEILQKTAHSGIEPQSVRDLISYAEWGVVHFDDDMAVAAAELWAQTRHNGLSLGDRACLALTQAVSGVALTMDRGWSGLEIAGADIHVIER